jgi:hypothetical protein
MAELKVPVQVAEDAAARLAELGMQSQFEQMLEHARQTASGLRAMRVTLEYDPECPHLDPGVVIWVHRDVPPEGPAADQTNYALRPITTWQSLVPSLLLLASATAAVQAVALAQSTIDLLD